MIKKAILAMFALLLFQNKISAQRWTEMFNDTTSNYYDIVKEFEAYWKDRPYERSQGYKVFRRWQWFTEPRVYPSGDMRLASKGHALEEYQKFLKENSTKRLSGALAAASTTANWTPIGPFGTPSGNNGSARGAGRIQAITLHPTNSSIFYVGTAAGGFWMTNDGGITYTTTTDQMASLGVSDIAIDPINTNNIYISTGDKDAGDTHATGVLKSMDGGLTWTQTGLSWTTSQQRRIYRLLINPVNPNTLFAATSVGIYRSFNAGTTWTMIKTGSYVDAEYKPGDTTTVYFVDGGSFYKTINGGNSFTNISMGTGFNRLSLAVTPANNSYAYVLASKNDNSFGGLFRSTNSGSNFSSMSTTPNIFDWSTTGSGAGGQGWYDIAIDASPANANEIIAGGVNSWKSTNGGANWTLNTHWQGAGNRPLAHADLHYVKYATATNIYLGTDGGVVITKNGGATYQLTNGNMNIAQIYKMGAASNIPSRIITGHQDNGSNLSNNTAWANVYGGDGMDCFISWSNTLTMVCSTQNGGFARSTNGGMGWSGITSGLTGNAPWVSPIIQDPTNANTYYCGYQNVFKSTNQGASWTAISNFNSSMDEIKVSPINSNTMLASSSSAIWRTTNGGTTWSIISGIVASSGAQITDVCMSNQNPNIIFATVSGYVNGNKVYKSTNGGVSWVNYSTGLPNIPVNCIVYVNNSPQGVYVGTDVGVYYREASMSSWIPYFTGLPNVIVDDMEIYYPTGKLRAATYGRGVWETDLYVDPLAIPIGGYYTNFNAACINIPITINDASSNNPLTWNWIFTGGSPSTSTLQNPSVTYSAAGVYSIILTSGNANGFSTPFVSTISVVNAPTVIPIPSYICLGQNAQLSINTNATNVFWSNGQQAMSINVSPVSNTIYNYTASIGACDVIGSNTVFVSTIIPQTPTVILSGNLLTTTTTAISYQWYLNGGAIPNATTQAISPTQNGYYSVWASNDGCLVSSSPYFYEEVINTTNLKNYSNGISNMQLSPNPVKDELNLKFISNYFSEITLEVVDGLGRVVINSKINVADKTINYALNVKSISAGVYSIILKNENGKATYKFIKED